MARKLRIQYEGALYHVINRGNYRRDVFETAGAAQAFETAMLEACEESGWRLHAHVVMRNHYHLALETPRANLVDGMHWLQTTFATRFNRLRSERGHLFQGRYQALPIENWAALADVVDYIHLNPVRAGIVTADQLETFRWSSLRKFLREGRPAVYRCGDWLAHHGFEDSAAGLKDYLDYLRELAGDEAEQKRRGFEKLSSGWAIGTEGWRKAIAKDHAHLALNSGMERKEIRELREASWTGVLEAELRRVGKGRAEIESDNYGAGWKIEIAQSLRKAGAPYAWISTALEMGKASSVRSYLAIKRTSI